MLGLKQGLFSKDSPTTSNWTPSDLLLTRNGSSYWWSSNYGVGADDLSAIDDGDPIGTWVPRTNGSNDTTRLFIDQSASNKDFLYDKRYVYSEDSENSKFTLFDAVGGSAQEFTLDGDFYMCFRVRFGTFTSGADTLWQDLNNTSKDFCRIQDSDTIRIKINNGSNRNFDFEESDLFDTDIWYNIEIIRATEAIEVFVDGVASTSNPITDAGNVTLDRIFAVSDGHVSDFIIIKGFTISNAERTKLKAYLDRLGDTTYMPGGLQT